MLTTFFGTTAGFQRWFQRWFPTLLQMKQLTTPIMFQLKRQKDGRLELIRAKRKIWNLNDDKVDF